MYIKDYFIQKKINFKVRNVNKRILSERKKILILFVTFLH